MRYPMISGAPLSTILMCATVQFLAEVVYICAIAPGCLALVLSGCERCRKNFKIETSEVTDYVSRR